MAVYAPPGQPGSKADYRARYDHWIGGEYVPPAKGQYFENPTPVTGQTFTEVARGTAEDIEAALDAAHAAAPAWGRTSVAARADILNKIATKTGGLAGQTFDVSRSENDKAASVGDLFLPVGKKPIEELKAQYQKETVDPKTNAKSKVTYLSLIHI